MSFRPVGKRHAIQEVVFVLGLSRRVTAAEMEALFSSHDRWRSELPKVERAQVFQVFMGSLPGGAPTPPPAISPVMFQSFRRDGTLEWQLQANDNWLAVNCLAYSRWDATYQQARSFLEKGFDALGDSRPEVTSVALQFIDAFIWDGRSEEYSAEELLNRESGFFPQGFRPQGPIWHFHEGQVEQSSETGSALINRTHIDAVLRDGRSETRIDTTLQLEVAKPTLDSAPPIETALNAFEGLHRRNKEILSQVISPAMQDRISLHRGHE